MVRCVESLHLLFLSLGGFELRLKGIPRCPSGRVGGRRFLRLLVDHGSEQGFSLLHGGDLPCRGLHLSREGLKIVGIRRFLLGKLATVLALEVGKLGVLFVQVSL